MYNVQLYSNSFRVWDGELHKWAWSSNLTNGLPHNIISYLLGRRDKAQKVPTHFGSLVPKKIFTSQDLWSFSNLVELSRGPNTQIALPPTSTRQWSRKTGRRFFIHDVFQGGMRWMATILAFLYTGYPKDSMSWEWNHCSGSRGLGVLCRVSAFNGLIYIYAGL